MFYVAAIPAMIILGLAKGGFGAIGVIVVPIIAIVISPVQAAGIVLPILVLSDLVGLVSYRKSFDRRTIAVFLPGAMIGIVIAWFAVSWVSEDMVRLIVGGIAIGFSVWFFVGRRIEEARPHHHGNATFWGTIAGFTSFFAHAGGPPFQVYAGPLKLEPRLFAGTMIYIFAAINAVKLVPFFLLGQFDSTNLATSAVLLPVSVPATLFGIWLVRRTRAETYYPVIYGLMMVVGVYLAGDALLSFAGLSLEDLPFIGGGA